MKRVQDEGASICISALLKTPIETDGQGFSEQPYLITRFESQIQEGKILYGSPLYSCCEYEVKITTKLTKHRSDMVPKLQLLSLEERVTLVSEAQCSTTLLCIIFQLRQTPTKFQKNK